jgi:hypothetical protein
MTGQGRVVLFKIDKPFDVALGMLRRAIALERLYILHEFDTAARVRMELRVGLKQNIVIYVDDPIQLLEATVMDPAGALFIPEPVVLSTADKGCRISVRSMQPVFGSDLPVSLRRAVANVHERIVSAIQRIAHKETAAGQMAECSTVPA